MGHVISWLPVAIIFLVLWACMQVISSCPSKCACTNSIWDAQSKITVLCTFKNLSAVPSQIPQNVTHLDVHGNNILSLDEALRNVTQLKFFNVSINNLPYVNMSIFVDMNSLQTLDMSNNVISAIHPATVNVRDSNNRTVSNNIQLSVTILNISSNRLKEIPSDIFQQLNSLDTLDLSNNDISVISVTMFQGLTSLKSLNLARNSITYIEPNSFRGLLLFDLQLSNNLLVDLEENLFSGLLNLTSLSLSENNITSISPNFMGNNNLEVLQMSNNSLQNISIPLFKSMKHLQELYLCNMPSLTRIAFNAFQGLPELKILYISHNQRLTFIHPNLFFDLTNLREVDLSYNNLSALSNLTFHDNLQLHKASLYGNAFECTCEIAWLVNQDVNTSVFDSQNLSCYFDGTNSTRLHTLLNLDLCPSFSLLNITNQEISLKVGSPARIICDFEADSSTIITWKTPRNRTFSYHPLNSEAVSHLHNINDVNLSSEFHKNHIWHNSSGYYSDLDKNLDHIILLSDGSLYIDYVLRRDAGPYMCIMQNSHHKITQMVNVRLQSALYDVKIISIIVGFACALSFFALNILYAAVSAGARTLVNKRRKDTIHRLLENLDTYKTAQFARLRDSYSSQLGRIRDQYHLQFGRLRENYSLQTKRVRKGCSVKVDRIRDNYTTQVGRLRMYSSHQIEQIREMYSNQLLKIRDYSSLQMGRMHEKYKLKQQHILKLLETMNLDNCKNVIDSECMRAESMIFDINIAVDDDDDEHPFSPLGSDSEYLTATSSETSSQDNLNSEVSSVLDHVVMNPPDAQLGIGLLDVQVGMFPSDIHVEMIPSDVQVEMIPSDVQVEMIPSDVQVEMIPSDVQVEMIPSDGGMVPSDVQVVELNGCPGVTVNMCLINHTPETPV